MSKKALGFREVPWTSEWEHPLEFWLVRDAPVIEDDRACDDQERRYRMDVAARDERAREVLRQGTALFGDRPKGRFCPCGCGAVLMRGMARHPEMDADYEEQWEFSYRCARGDDLDDFMNAPVEPQPPRCAVSQAQILWARDMLAQFPRKSREQICRENGGISWAQLEHFAKTSLAGLPVRASQRAKDQAKAEAKTNTMKPKAFRSKGKGV